MLIYMVWVERKVRRTCHVMKVKYSSLPVDTDLEEGKKTNYLFIRVEYDYTCQIYIDLHLLLSTRANTFPILHCRAVTIGDVELAQLSGTN